MPAFFAQECPTCGRTLHINPAHTNRRVVCKHCQGAFVPAHEEHEAGECGDWRTAIMRRADELLALVALHAELAPSS